MRTYCIERYREAVSKVLALALIISLSIVFAYLTFLPFVTSSVAKKAVIIETPVQTFDGVAERTMTLQRDSSWTRGW